MSSSLRVRPEEFPVLLFFLALLAVARAKNGAGGLSSREWSESETVAHASLILSQRHDLHLYSDGTDALGELAHVNADELPRRSEVDQNDLHGHWPPDRSRFSRGPTTAGGASISSRSRNWRRLPTSRKARV